MVPPLPKSDRLLPGIPDSLLFTSTWANGEKRILKYCMYTACMGKPGGGGGHQHEMSTTIYQ